MKKKVALIGSGNILFKDEGLGVYIVEYIEKNYDFSAPVDIIEGGSLGLRLMELLQEYEEVIIVNTASEKNRVPGEIIVKTTEQFLEGEQVKKTAGEVEIAEMLQVCSLEGNSAKTTVVSIVPNDILSVEAGVSEVLREEWEKYIQTLLEQLESLGVAAEQRENCIELDEIVKSLFNS
ncbi:MAG: hydrogenase maturation protease [Sulfurimonas sp.]